MISIGIAIALAIQSNNAILDDPTYKQLSRLVGGHWHNPAGKNFVIDNRFRFEADGKLIQSSGSVTAGGKTVLFMHASMGWDQAKKSVFYLDIHDNDTVYSGHIKLIKDTLVFDFGELYNPKPHYMIKMKFIDDDHYEASEGQGAKLVMTRSRE